MSRTIRDTGFTLVELLVVIVVIAILAAVSVVAYGGISGKAQDAAVVSDLRNVRNSLEIYKSENGTYPVVYGLAELMDAIKSGGKVKMQFSTGSYARPDIYQDSSRYPESTVIAGYGVMGGDICIIAKSKSGQNYLFTTAGVIAKTTTINPMGGAHDFRTTCRDEGGVYPALFPYGSATL